MAKTKLGSNAQFIGGSKALTLLGNGFCYAYSGQEDLASSGALIMLDFNTGSYMIRATVQSGHDTTQMSGSQTLQTTIKFNGVIVYDHLTLFSSADTQTTDLGSPIELIIPPFTEVIVSGFTSDTGPIPTTYQLVGTIHV